MIDFVLAYGQTLSDHFLNNIDRIYEDPMYPPFWTAQFKRNSFAPGIWAGTEGSILTTTHSKYKIEEVLFEEKGLRLEKL
jgi:hypothetical protein